MAIRLDKIKNKKQFREAEIKRNQIIDVLSDQPKTVMELSAETGMAEPTVRHHLHKMEKREQLTALIKYNVFGDRTKRYFKFGTNIEIYNDEYAQNTRSQVYYRKAAESLMNTPKTKQEIADILNVTLKRAHDIVYVLMKNKIVKMVMIKNLPWRMAAKHYYHPNSDPAEIKKQVKAIESRYKNVTKKQYAEMMQNEIIEKPISDIPSLPDNLLKMMGYTNHKPTLGQRFNVDQYSANHQDWNKYQSRKGLTRSNVGCSMQMMIESAPGTF